MSFGFSVGDFLTAIELASRIRREFIDAPTQFKAISDDVRSLSIVLQDADIAFSDRDLNDDEKSRLEDVDRGCRNVLDELQGILDKYTVLDSEGGSVGKRIKRVWNRFKWQPESIDKLRGRISANIGLLNAAIGLRTQDNVVKLVRHQEDQGRRAVLDWITKIDYALQLNDFLSRRQEGTGQWLLDSTEYQKWVETKEKTLFCPGIPGAGKTILISIVIEELTARFQNDKSIGIAYIYCNFHRHDEQNAENLLASLLKQLTQGRPSLPDTIKSLYDSHANMGMRPSFDKLSSALQSVAAMYSRVFLVVDALDECQISQNGREAFLSEIFSLQEKCGANLFATSRSMLGINEKFQGSISLEIRASDSDVRRYVDGHMSQLPSFVRRSPDLQEEVKTEIVKAVDGMFLLAQLHLESLVGKRSPKLIRAALKNLPSGSNAYDDAYEEAMLRIEGQLADQEETAKQVLSWITCARRPLTTLELRHALAVEEGELELDEENLPELENLVSVCAGLVTIDEESEVIRLVHYTTQEYFERTKSHWFPNAETYITTVCINYLSFDVFGRGACRTDDEYEERLRAYPFFEYAVENWGHHARKVCTLSQVLSQAVVNGLMCEARVGAWSQGLLADKQYLSHSNYSQELWPGMKALHLTAHFGVSIIMKLLLDRNGGDADCQDKRGLTPLYYAVWYGHEAIVKLLLDTGKVDVNCKDEDGITPLCDAAINGYEAIVKLLLDTGKVDVNCKDEDGITPLCDAAINGYEAIVKLLLDTGKVDVNCKDKNGMTPLAYAAWDGHEAIVRLLLDTGKVDVNWADRYGMTPLDYAVKDGYEAIIKLLLDAGAEKEIVDSVLQT